MGTVEAVSLLISMLVFVTDPKMMNNLAVGISIPVQEAIFVSRKNPSPGWPESVYQLIGKTCCLYLHLRVSSHFYCDSTEC